MNADTPAEVATSPTSPAGLRTRIRPLPGNAGEETFLPFLDLCFNWSMDRPRIETADLADREDAVFYFKNWGRHGDIAVAAYAEADPESPIIGLAWVRLADITDVVVRTEPNSDDDFAAAMSRAASFGSPGTEVVRSEVAAADGESEKDASAGDGASPAVRSGADGPFTGYGWVAADIPELSLAVLPDHQGQGIGGTLLDAVCSLARMSGFPAVSLSVEDGNGAAKLYADHGFDSVGRSGDSDILVRRLR